MKPPQRGSKEAKEQSIGSGTHRSGNFCELQVQGVQKVGFFLHSSWCTLCRLGGKKHREKADKSAH